MSIMLAVPPAKIATGGKGSKACLLSSSSVSTR
jgi:hypothetical protein